MNQLKSSQSFFRLIWSFSRPHTILGTTISVSSIGLLAFILPASPAIAKSFTLTMLLWAILAALVPSLCANVYIVGLNQLTDIPIDRINKPRLPLAAGLLSIGNGKLIVAVMGLLALLTALPQGFILGATVAISMAIGTGYSLPPLRLKRFPFWAALCIVGVRGVVVNIGFYLFFLSLFISPLAVSLNLRNLPPEIWALTLFVVCFALAIALFKDIPDLDGDRQFNILTLTVKLGQVFVFKLVRWLLTISYLLMVLLTMLGFLPSVQPFIMISVHLFLALLLWAKSPLLMDNQRLHFAAYYQFIWRLFFVEYIVFPVACLFRIAGSSY